MQLSDEQLYIIEQIKQGKNAIVCAVAGSGKSSTVLSAAQQMPELQFLQLTYNASLRAEIKEKVRELGLTNIKIHTYHSLAVRYYLPNCFTDTGLRRILYHDLAPRQEIPLCNVLVIDETQDMTLVYFQIVQKFIKDMIHNRSNIKLHSQPEENQNVLIKNGQEVIFPEGAGGVAGVCGASPGFPAIQLLILGDELQSLYEFKGSDARFLTLAEQIWKNCPFLRTKEFSNCSMKMSYRITDEICAFVNNVMIGQHRMNSCRSDETVKYVRNSRTNLEKTVIFEVNRLLAAGAKPSDFFILGASVKSSKSVVRKMENVLVSQGIPCYVPMMENENIDDRVIDGKIVFSTFHSVKGRQRPYVFIVGFDNSYFEFYARTLPTDRCPNTLYVGATRASKALFLLEGDNFAGDRPLPFLKLNHHEMRAQPYIQFKGQPKSIFYADERTVPESINLVDKHFETPTNMIKFIPESIIEEISPIVDRIFISEQVLENELDIPAIIQTGSGHFEEVSDLNGIAIPAMYYDELTNRFSKNEKSNILLSIINQTLDQMKSSEHTYIRALVDALGPCTGSIKEYLYLANIYVATQEKLYFKLKQIDAAEYGWLSDWSNCRERLNDVIGKECADVCPRIEETILNPSMDKEHVLIDAALAQFFENKKFRFTARTDLITASTVWEIKCTSKISMDHLLQVVIYAWLWLVTKPDDPKVFKIFNIKTGEILRLDASREDLDYIVISILQGKYLEHEPISDEEFIRMTRN
jgi:hypothetical protein